MATKMRKRNQELGESGGDPGDDDSAEEQQANREAIRKVERASQREEEDPDERNPDRGHVVDLDEEEEEEEEAHVARPDRQQRRSNRFKEMTERARLADERAEKLERDLAEARQNQARFEGQFQQAMQQVARPVGQGPQVDPMRAKWEDLNEQIGMYEQEHLRLINAKQMTPEEDRRLRSKVSDLAFQREQLNTQIALRGAGYRPPDPMAAQRAAFHAQHSDVMGDNNRRMWSEAKYNQLVAEGKPTGMATANEAVEETRRHFKLGKYQNQQQSRRDSPMRAKTQGAAGRSGTREDGGKPEKPNVVRMTKSDMKMARARFPKLDPNDAYKKFAKEVMSQPDD